MNTAILVDLETYRRLEHMAEELRQVATTDHPAVAKRHLVAALEVCMEIDG
jgi:hypothetical protein